MNREIIFRGKTAKGKWVYGAYYKQEHFYGDEEEVHCIITTKDVLSNDLGLDYEEVIPETVGQYTGIKDKNGKKVYEGDILKVDREMELWENETKHETFFGVVEYDEENTRFVTNGKPYKNMPIFIKYNISYEIVGTVFDKES